MAHRRRFHSLILGAALLALAVPGVAQQRNSPSPLADLLLAEDTTREELVQLYRAFAAASYVPPACAPGNEMFTDVPANSPFCPWIEELARRGITSGCSANKYCPGSPVSRGQLAVFLIRAVELTRSPRAQAIAGRNVTVGSAYRKGQWTVTRPAGDPVGVFCLAVEGIDPTLDPAIVTVEWGASMGFDLLAYWYAGAGNCSNGEYEVRTYDFAAGGAPVLSDDVKFLITIP